MGSRLDINELVRDGTIGPGGKYGWLRVTLANGEQQTIATVREARHLGGHQVYFICPMEGVRAMVL